MAEVWDLPEIEALQPEGHGWLLHLMHASTENQRAMMLMTLWRIWHAHNEITHDKPCPTIEGSRRYLVSYLNSLMLIKQFPEADIKKGKMVIDQRQSFKKVHQMEPTKKKVRQKWLPPESNEAKLNVDGAFSTDGRAGIGMVMRDSNGVVIFAACRKIQQCQDATEAEIQAIEDGLQLALQWSQVPFSVESDCSEAIQMIKQSSPNISAHAFRINVIRELLRERDSRLIKINREANTASHELARLGRVQGRTEMWLGESPPEIADVIVKDCNSVSG
jgi:ribonuclease HI